MWLPPRLALRRWQLRYQAVPRDGRPLTNKELYKLGKIALALLDECGTRRLALFEEGAEIRAAAENEGEWR